MSKNVCNLRIVSVLRNEVNLATAGIKLKSVVVSSGKLDIESLVKICTSSRIVELTHDIILIVNIGNRISCASLILEVTSLKLVVENRCRCNLRHEYILPYTAYPLLLDEEGSISGDRSITSHNRLASDLITRVLDQLTKSFGIVVVESIGSHYTVVHSLRRNNRLKATVEEVTSGVFSSEDSVEISCEVYLLSSISFDNILNVRLKAKIRFGLIGIADNLASVDRFIVM